MYTTLYILNICGTMAFGVGGCGRGRSGPCQESKDQTYTHGTVILWAWRSDLYYVYRYVIELTWSHRTCNM